ncbi:MAG: aquaporin [Thermoflavifilum sp.]|nr:aquaporin [Thermoflavifilum sp.]
MKNWFIEFIGTFFLVLTMLLSWHHSLELSALATGAMMMAIVYLGGRVSEGYFNPGISLGVAMQKRFSFGRMIAYWIAQFVAAICAALIGWLLIGHPQIVVQQLGQLDIVRGLVAEFLFSFVLVLTVLATAVSSRSAGNSYFGLAIGFVLFAGIASTGSLSGGAFNSATGLGLCLFGLSAWFNIWIYIVGNLLGGIIAGLVYKAIIPAEKP